MDVVARALSQPRLDLGVLVGGIVIDGQVHIELSGHVSVQLAEKGEEFLVPMPRFARPVTRQ